MKPHRMLYTNLKRLRQLGIYAGIVYCLLLSCKPKSDVVAPTFKQISPVYNNIHLLAQNDTVNFLLPENTSARIGSFNCFKQDTTTYIAFYNRGAKCIIVYDFHSRKISMKKYLRQWVKSDKLDKATVYVRKFDSIYVATRTAFFLFDSTGVVKSKTNLGENSDYSPFISNMAPVIFKDDLVYVGIKPSINETSIKAQREFKVLFRLNMAKNEKDRCYSFPSIYQENLYGYPFHEYSYCINDKGNLVFSFAADTNIYETNLSDYHMAYLGRSKSQSEPITPVTKAEFEKGASYRAYSLKDSYEAIFFDPYKKRYIRQVKHKMSAAEFESRLVGKKRSAIILDEHFRIIGQSEVNGQYSIESMFFLEDGKIYARTNMEDKQALHFIQLTYQESDTSTNSVQLAHRNTK